MIVVDASAFLELLLRSPAGRIVETALAGHEACAPHLLDAEVLHRLVRFGKQGVLDRDDVEDAVALLRDAPVRRVDHRPLLVDAASLTAALSGYDALYAALARALTCPLLTTDARLARTAGGQLGIDVVAAGG